MRETCDGQGPRPHVWRVSFTSSTWLIRERDMTLHKCDMTHSYVQPCLKHDTPLLHRGTWLVYTCEVTPLYVQHDSCICTIWLIHMREMTHSYVTWLIHMRHDSFIWDMTHSYVTWLIHMCNTTLASVLYDSFICATQLLHLYDMTHFMWDIRRSYVWHDSFICVTWLIHICDMTHSYVRHGSFICVTWLIHTCDMTHSYGRHDSFIRVTWLIHMCAMTHSYVWHDSFICATWLIHMRDTTLA